MPFIDFLLHVPSSTDNLAMIRDFVAKVGEKAGFDEKEVTKLALAVDEACSNVIEHAYGGDDANKEVRVRVSYDSEQVVVEVVDTGRGFDPAQIPVKDTDQLVRERRSGGLGWRLIRSIMDEVQYHMVPGEKNELRMVKKIRRSA
ncbi:MAG: ATP-binding protein [Bryobacterales bacterium]|nr:ATP-binding protein [Bryobacterales bacterium]